jgi:hypothetical protein
MKTDWKPPRELKAEWQDLVRCVEADRSVRDRTVLDYKVEDLVPDGTRAREEV